MTDSLADTLPVEVPETLRGWRGECPFCRDHLHPLEEIAGIMKYQCLGCGAFWWHKPGHGMFDKPPRW